MTLEQGKLWRDDGITRAEQGAPEDWNDRAREAIERLAREKQYLTGDDLWTRIEKPPEPRASGAVFRWAHKHGLIDPTNRFTQTKYASAHASPIRIWRSRVYGE